MPIRFRRGPVVALAVLLCAVVGVVTWLLVSGDDPGGPTPSPPGTASREPGPEAVAPPPAEVPLTVVKIDNVPAARPQSGLDAADVVYVEPVEGGFTRLAAVYSTQPPDVTGPVRSARESDVELLAQYGDPALVFSGAAPEIEPVLTGSTARLVRPRDDPDGFYRDPARTAPHNLYARPALLPRGAGPAPTGVLPRGEVPTGGRQVSDHTVAFERDEYGFTWSSETGRWLVTLNGTPVTSVGAGEVGAASVVVQRVDLAEGTSVRDASGSPSPVVRSVGTGPVTVLREGRSFDGTWSRPSATDGTRFTTESGQPLPLADGPVWVLLLPR
ncbi:DUF3048 domain-containing protein [Saccharomonospora glauca]|uniref:DUF3048 domain-containing protein n=1 Tax=Saccharomonospora glauca K62 TaxID=928724 RepID=I1D3F9_9PSEU|nr:DUF3048 domain-containing protein [Saccharomonospora glauca]EIE99483.1 Protein of unknown function (DUF3048) [Saccharomonospora glauca K62]